MNGGKTRFFLRRSSSKEKGKAGERAERRNLKTTEWGRSDKLRIGGGLQGAETTGRQEGEPLNEGRGGAIYTKRKSMLKEKRREGKGNTERIGGVGDPCREGAELILKVREEPINGGQEKGKEKKKKRRTGRIL